LAALTLEVSLEYALVITAHPIELVNEVNDWLTKGWQPLGGAFVHNDEYYQAVIRERPMKLPKLPVHYRGEWNSEPRT
jgi:hypothetical protein